MVGNIATRVTARLIASSTRSLAVCPATCSAKHVATSVVVISTAVGSASAAVKRGTSSSVSRATSPEVAHDFVDDLLRYEAVSVGIGRTD
jgi:hypothetical protein